MSVLARAITRRSIAHLISFYYDSLFVVFVAFVCLSVCLFVCLLVAFAALVS